MADLPFVSVLIPCRNEEGFIGTVLNNVREQDYPDEKMEIFVLDGMSDDGTRSEIAEIASRDKRIQVLDNPKRIVPTGLNIGIKKAKGDVIVRMDAHCEYPNNYVSYLISELERLKADNVGVAMIAHPRNTGLKALAISAAISSPFGIGDSHHRTGIEEPIEMDSVPFGCYPKSVFERIGLFDEELVRNQDDEFNARLKKSGGKIWLLPEIEIKYLARDTIFKTARMFYYYGFFKPLVNRKIGSAATVRQFVPPIFVITLFASLFAVTFMGQWGVFFAAIALAPYLMLNILFSVKESLKANRFLLIFYLPFIFFTIHIAYGWGYLRGAILFLLLRSDRKPKDLSTNR